MSAAATDRGRWEERHRQTLADRSLEPSSLLVEFSDLLREAPGGRALDVACGNGRNAFFLASLGYDVTAVDFSTPAVEFVERRANDLGVQLRVVERDVAALDPGVDRFAVVANFMFLDRNLAPRLIRCLAPGGFLYFETYTVAEREVLGRDIRREFLLEPNEALRLFSPLTVLYYREGILTAAGKGRPRAVARLVARREPPSQPAPMPS